MIIAFSLLIALIGVLMFALSANPKLQKIGEICLFCGLLAFLLELPAHYTQILPK